MNEDLYFDLYSCNIIYENCKQNNKKRKKKKRRGRMKESLAGRSPEFLSIDTSILKKFNATRRCQERGAESMPSRLNRIVEI